VRCNKTTNAIFAWLVLHKENHDVNGLFSVRLFYAALPQTASKCLISKRFGLYGAVICQALGQPRGTVAPNSFAP
jgi:hypothetical protein